MSLMQRDTCTPGIENESNSHNGVHQSKRLPRSGKSSNAVNERNYKEEKDRVECSDNIDCDINIIYNSINYK